MSVLARRDTAPELAVRSLLHAAGLRYRVVCRVPGRARRTIDIAFTRAKVAVFIDGCFWHGCAAHGARPGTNSDWWTAKLAANQARDIDTTEYLASIGWRVLRFWEHEEPQMVVAVVQEVLGTVERQHDLSRRDPRSVADPEGTTGEGHLQSC